MKRVSSHRILDEEYMHDPEGSYQESIFVCLMFLVQFSTSEKEY